MNLCILRPNKKAYDLFQRMASSVDVPQGSYDDGQDDDYDDILSSGESLTPGDRQMYRMELNKHGYVDSTSNFAITYCVEDQHLFYCTDTIQHFARQSRPLCCFRHEYDRKVDSKENEVDKCWKLTGPDGGMPTYWRCPECKTEIQVLDK